MDYKPCFINLVGPAEGQGRPREGAQRLTSLMYLASEVGTSAVLCPGQQRPCLIHLLGNVFLRSSAGGLKQHKDDE